MPRSRPAYSLEFWHKLIQLLHAGRSPTERARNFEFSAQTIRDWVASADADRGKRHDALTSMDIRAGGRSLSR